MPPDACMAWFKQRNTTVQEEAQRCKALVSNRFQLQSVVWLRFHAIAAAADLCAAHAIVLTNGVGGAVATVIIFIIKHNLQCNTNIFTAIRIITSMTHAIVLTNGLGGADAIFFFVKHHLLQSSPTWPMSNVHIWCDHRNNHHHQWHSEHQEYKCLSIKPG